MATVPVPNTAEIDVRYTINGQPAENTLFAEFASAITEAALDALATAVETWFIDEMIPLMVDNLVYKEVYVKDLTAGSGKQSLANTAGGTPGGAAAGALPGSVAWVVKFVTGLAGRSFRGRNYVSGLSTGTVLGNTVDPTFAAAVLAAYSLLLPAGAALPTDWVWVVVSKFAAGAPRVSGVTTPVGAVSYTDLTVDSQRNRTRS